MSADSALLSAILDKVAPFKVRPHWLCPGCAGSTSPHPPATMCASKADACVRFNTNVANSLKGVYCPAPYQLFVFAAAFSTSTTTVYQLVLSNTVLRELLRKRLLLWTKAVRGFSPMWGMTSACTGARNAAVRGLGLRGGRLCGVRG